MQHRTATATFGIGLLLAAIGSARADEILRLDFENAGNLASDTSGAGVVGAGSVNQLLFSGSLTQSSTSQVGSFSANFDAASSDEGFYILFDDAALPDFTPDDSFSLSFWMQPSAEFVTDTQDFRGIVSGAVESGNPFEGQDFQFDNGGEPAGSGNGATSGSRLNSESFMINLFAAGAQAPTDSWTHVSLSYNGPARDSILFVDGEFRGVSNNPDGLALESLVIGGNRNESRLYDGLLDDVRLFDNATVIDDQGDIQTLGDLDSQNGITAADWAIFQAGQDADLSGLTPFQAYQMGDLDFDGDNDVIDFNTFKDLFDAENGAGAFAAMLSVPEPGVLSLVAIAAVGVVGRGRRNRRRLLPAALVLLVGLSATPSAEAVTFDFGSDASLNFGFDPETEGEGGVFSNTAIFPNADGQHFGVVDGIGLTIAPVPATGADFANSQWGADASGIGIRSRDAAGGTDVDPDETGTPVPGGQRRRLNGTTGEAIQFWFDTDVVLDSTVVNLFGGGETLEVGFVSGVDPFGGTPFTETRADGPATVPVDLGGVFVEADTVLSLTASTAVASGILWDSLTVSLPGPDPLTLQVFTDTGELRLANESTADYTIDYFTITSDDAEEDGGSLLDANFTGLAGAAGFPAGDGSGNGWEPGGNNDDDTLTESFLTGSSTILSTDPAISLGTAFDVGDSQDLAFTYHIAGSGEEFEVGSVVYMTSNVGGLLGDADDDGDVDGDDLIAVQTQFGSVGPPPSLLGDADDDGDVDGDDLIAVQTEFGNVASVAVPEPSAAWLVVAVAVGYVSRRRG